MITTTCSKTTKTFKTSKEAIKYYKKGINSCDPHSSEVTRYENIITRLEMGKTDVDDSDLTLEEMIPFLSEEEKKYLIMFH